MRVAAAAAIVGLLWLASGGAAARARIGRWLPGLGGLGRLVARLAALGAALLGLLAWSALLPDRSLYALGPPWRWALQAGQLAGLALILVATPAALRAAAGEDNAAGNDPGPVDAPPATGPYALVRHPVATGGLLALWLVPQMTVNRAALAAALSVVLLADTVAADRRRAERWGAAYAAYRAAVPRLVPRPGGGLPPEPAAPGAPAERTAPDGPDEPADA